MQHKTDDERAKELDAKMDTLSDAAMHILSCSYFAKVMMGKSILAKAVNDVQQKAFEELLSVGFVHGDVERGVYGYRSTYDGQFASMMWRNTLADKAPNNFPF